MTTSGDETRGDETRGVLMRLDVAMLRKQLRHVDGATAKLRKCKRRDELDGLAEFLSQLIRALEEGKNVICYGASS